ncbi:MAG: hypothetical protein JO133_00570 [Burkholderiaceae bacterium]|nr:hypothetical protein [Burkholderiaceae bacterium]
MIVLAGMSDELWDWLMDRGWREVTYRPDRRTYRHVPVSCVRKLIDATDDRRSHDLELALARAEFRDCYRVDPDVLPTYVQRR